MSNATGERVFRKDDGYCVHTLVFPPGVTEATSTYVTESGRTGIGCQWFLSEVSSPGTEYREVLPEAVSEPTPDPLTAYTTFVAEIDAAFLETNRQAIQIGYQRARDRLSDVLNQSRGAM